MPTHLPTAEALQRALSIAEEMQRLEAELAAVLNVQGKASPPAGTTAQARDAKPRKGKRKRTISPEGRERISAAARARWAKVKQQG